MRNKRIGILGGGQLGKMMGIAAQKWNLDFWILDQSKHYPAAKNCTHFELGDFKNYDDVLEFGRKVDIIGIEIENVNVEALEQLEKEGKTVIPSSKALRIIKDKGLQKQFYADHQFPTAPFLYFDNTNDLFNAIETGQVEFPFVQKSRTGGYDGRGVHLIHGIHDYSKLLEVPFIVEELVDIKKEIGVIAARNQSGDVATYDPVEMVFDQHANLVDHLSCPAQLTEDQKAEASTLAYRLIEQMDIVGLLAVELFETNDGRLLINEVAPRCHNSGHHTIEACATSQFEQQLRCLLNLPLGSTSLRRPAIMMNLLGEDEFSGQAEVIGFSESLGLNDLHVHIYGKKETRPNRKMGHVTIICDDTTEGLKTKEKVRDVLKIVSRKD